MARGIQVAFTLNPREFLRGLKQIEVSTEDVVDALEDIEDAGDDAFDLDTREAARDLGRVEDAAEDVRREMDDVGDEAKDAERAFGRFGRSAKSDMDKVERAARSTEDEIGDIEDEANQSAKEFGAAFRGDPVEALEEVQSYLAEIVSVKLPGFAGALATIAGGAALGLVVAGVEKWREKQERINEIATDFIGIIQESVDGPLAATNAAYDDLIDKQLTLAVLEEASAAQLTNLAILAAARGQTTQEYVQDVLTGEISTQEELQSIQERRNAIADELLRITTDNTTANDDQIPILQAQDDALREQGEALRSVGGFINENVAGYEKAQAAQDALNEATEASQEYQRAFNRAAADGKVVLDNAGKSARDLGDDVRNVPDIDIKAKVDRREIDNLPTQRSLTVVANVRAATAKAQRLLDSGVI